MLITLYLKKLTYNVLYYMYVAFQMLQCFTIDNVLGDSGCLSINPLRLMHFSESYRLITLID